MSAMWDTFGYRGTARGQRGYYPCKDMIPLYQGSTPIEPSFLGQYVTPYAESPYNPVMGREIWHENEGMSAHLNSDGHISPDVRIFNLFTPPQIHRRNEYIDPTYGVQMMSKGDYAASIVASGIGKMNGGGGA
jgi:hypothetical protein